MAETIVIGNEIINTDDVYDVIDTQSSSTSPFDPTIEETTYYCVFRNNWTATNHPIDYPDLARWGNPVLFSHTKEFAPILIGRQATFGLEQLAETSFTDSFIESLNLAGIVVGNYSEGEGFFLTGDDTDITYLPPVKVSIDYPYISGVMSISPSPDWFSTFYLFNTINEYDQTFYESFKIHTYPFDAGTDDGITYTDVDRDRDPKGTIERITVNNSPNQIFINSAGTNNVEPVAEIECILNACTVDLCSLSIGTWPPPCDVLKDRTCIENTQEQYPGCLQALLLADRDRDGFVRINEYLLFIQRYGKKVCAVETDSLSLQQASAFNALACVCRSIEGAAEDCCIGDNAGIPTTGALLDDDAKTPQQKEFFNSVCKVTDETLTKSNDCTQPPSITPAVNSGSQIPSPIPTTAIPISNNTTIQPVLSETVSPSVVIQTETISPTITDITTANNNSAKPSMATELPTLVPTPETMSPTPITNISIANNTVVPSSETESPTLILPGTMSPTPITNITTTPNNTVEPSSSPTTLAPETMSPTTPATTSTATSTTLLMPYCTLCFTSISLLAFNILIS